MIDLKPKSISAHVNLGYALQDIGRLLEAEASYLEALKLDPRNTQVNFNIGVMYYHADRFEEAIKHLEAVGSKKAKMYILRCLYLMDDRTSFCDLLEHFVSEREINAMVGSLVSRSEIRYGLNVKNLFCKKPLNYLQTVDLTTQYDFQNLFTKPMETLLVQNRVPMRRQSLLSNGVQTAGNLFELGATPTAEIEKIIRVEIDNYLTKFRDSGEGFLKNWPSEYSLSGWLVSLRSGGELAPHIHEEGWLSGTIYINVPSDLEDDSGSLVVTMEEDKYLSAQSTGYKKVVEISTGTLVLFPASLLHYTIPFESKEQRIVLAFDVIPKKKTMLGV